MFNMKVQICDKKKKEIFVSLFQLLKNCSTLINITFETDIAHIQGMDKSHVCLFDVKLKQNWFTNYFVQNTTQICFDSNVFYSIISVKSENHNLIIQIKDSEPDVLHINFQPETTTHKTDFKKTFKMPLVDYEYEEINISNIEYDAEFSLSSKQISDIFSQLNNFGNNIIIKCSEKDITLKTNEITGEMIVEIPTDDLISYSIIEDEHIILTYNLTYINKMCITNKLSNNINFSLSNNCPMKILYDLGDDSFILFFIAPNIND